MSILNLKKASVFKNKLLTTEQKKLVTHNLKFEDEPATGAATDSLNKNKANFKYLSEMDMWHGNAWATVIDMNGESEKHISLDKALLEGALCLIRGDIVYYPNPENPESMARRITSSDWWEDGFNICINNCDPADKLMVWNEYLRYLQSNPENQTLSDYFIFYDGASKEFLNYLSHDIKTLENAAIAFKKATNEITEIIINENKKIFTKLDNLKNKELDFSKGLSRSRNFIKDFEKFKKTSIKQIEKIKALAPLVTIREYILANDLPYPATLVQSFAHIITGFFLHGEANKKLFADLSESNNIRQDCQTKKDVHLDKQSALKDAQQMELGLVDESLKNEKLIIKGSKSDSALQASLSKETHKDHNALLFSLLGGLVVLGFGLIYYIFQENMYMEDFGELFGTIIASIIMTIIGGFAFETGWGILLAVAGVIVFFSTIWESAFALSALAILGIFGLVFFVLVVNWDNIEGALKKGNIDKISKKITNLKDSANNEIQASTQYAQTKKNEIKANFQNDLVDLSRLSVPSVTYLKKTFKNLDVAKEFDYAAFKKEGKALSKALSTAEKNNEKNAHILQDAILLQLKNEITLADFQHDLRKGTDSFDDLLNKYEVLLDELSKQANYVEKIIEDTEKNLDGFGKAAARLNEINLKEA